MNYQSEKADALEAYVFRYHDLSGTVLHLYRGLRWLERERAGLCKTVCAGYRDIADAAGINVKSMKKALSQLQQKGVVEVTFGSSIKLDKKATIIRRKSLDEIKLNSIQGDSDTDRLARKLSDMSFLFNGKSIRPLWTVSRTGRVISSKPNIQGVKSDDRLSGLIAGLKKGQVVIHSDIKQAEPSIVKHLLGIQSDRDLYAQYMMALGCPRSEAKRAVNMLTYCRDTKAVYGHWPKLAQAALSDYVQRLHDYKVQLFSDSRKSRSVTTISGRTIFADKGDRLHAGQIMNWRVQGTVADIINVACLRLLDDASAVIPLHDAVYAVLPSDRSGEVETAIIGKAREIGLTLQVSSEVHHAC